MRLSPERGEGSDTLMVERSSDRDSMTRKLRGYFLTGLVAILPIGITLFILWKIFLFLDNLVPYAPPGLGFVSLVILITLLGVLTRHLVGTRVSIFWENFLGRIPVVRRIYYAASEIVQALMSERKTMFRQVVLVEYPRKGLYSVGFTVRHSKVEVHEKTEEDVVGVFIPTTPNPTSGFLIFVPKNDVIPLDMSPEDGLKFILSGGVFAPKESRFGLKVTYPKKIS